jgi:hypothetical protein
MKAIRLFWMILLTAALPLIAQDGTAVFAPFISGLKGEIRNNRVRLSWMDSNDVQGTVYIYRSNFPFEGSDPLREIEIKPVEVPYGVQFYEEEIKETLDGTICYFAAASDLNGRSYNVPILFNNTIRVQVTGDSPIGDNSSNYTLTIPNRNATPAEMSAGRWYDSTLAQKNPRVFIRDLEDPPASREEYKLISIVRGSFAAKKWETARKELTNFLDLPLSPEIRFRAGFYLGQCYYFLRRPRESLSEFIAFREAYPSEADEWIQAMRDM